MPWGALRHCVWVASWSRDVPRRRAGMVPGMVVRHNMVVRGGSWELWRTVRAGNTGNRGFHGDRGGTPLHNRLSGTCRGAEPDGTRDAGCGVWDTGRGDGDLAPHAPATSTLETTGPTTEPTSPTATNGIGSRRDHPPALHAPLPPTGERHEGRARARDLPPAGGESSYSPIVQNASCNSPPTYTLQCEPVPSARLPHPGRMAGL